MILTWLIQIAETRDRINSTPRTVAIFLDKWKYHLSRPAPEGPGTARDKGVHIFMGFQAIDELRDCPPPRHRYGYHHGSDDEARV